ncbi:MAG: hypothetical protein ACLFOY_07215 [Desulfatibacillaceae bacterium]
MPPEENGRSRNLKRNAGVAAVIVAVFVFVGILAIVLWPESTTRVTEVAPPPGGATAEGTEGGPEQGSGKVIDYDRMTGEGDTETSRLMEERKDKYGIDESLDMIINPDESIRVGGKTVPMREIIEDVRVERGEIVERELGERELGEIEGRQGEGDEFGVHVVQPGDNIWNIHFRLLKEHFASKGVKLSPTADEPKESGYSSGVGKILKFSENLVFIYNLRTGRLENDLDLIQPRSKVVVYNMTEVFELLQALDYRNMDMIRFDGDTLWLPPEQ